jgi:hypothetical protein
MEYPICPFRYVRRPDGPGGHKRKATTRGCAVGAYDTGGA